MFYFSHKKKKKIVSAEKMAKNFKGDIRGKSRDLRRGESQSLVMLNAKVTTKEHWFSTTIAI